MTGDGVVRSEHDAIDDERTEDEPLDESAMTFAHGGGSGVAHAENAETKEEEEERDLSGKASLSLLITSDNLSDLDAATHKKSVSLSSKIVQHRICIRADGTRLEIGAWC